MRLSEHARSVVRPRDAWIAVVIVGVIAVSRSLVQQIPHGVSWLWGGALVLIWIGTFVQLYRHGLRALTLPYAILIVGYTLYAGGHLWQHPSSAISWLANIGLLFVAGGMLAPYVEFGKKRDTPSLNPTLHKEQE